MVRKLVFYGKLVFENSIPCKIHFGRNNKIYRSIIVIMVNITLDNDQCRGSHCGACAYICPTNVFVIKEKIICPNSPQYCKLCYKCLEICPTAALNLKKLEGECI
jgi:ferredoxin